VLESREEEPRPTSKRDQVLWPPEKFASHADPAISYQNSEMILIEKTSKFVSDCCLLPAARVAVH